ncbi:hypothetical protein BDY19DRAFT_1041796 [Irpex rosettiformis]|uniref:Uncharacterized protein n=1 Tax=Irpex rosettiformis TaxID=378272 RepID=A0ACB8U424_9APHY|nr:hypothetical protein BDY19DRAFT_1041796 [Irpex rosettiformis]
MDKASSIVAALDAGKLPSQEQVSQWIDWLLNSQLSQVEPSADSGELSQYGRVLVGDVRNLLTAYRLAGEHKNGDNLIQQAFWHLHQADITNTSPNVNPGEVPDQVQQDASAIAGSIRTVLSVLLSTIGTEGENIFHDFASFLRLALADAADYVSKSAGSAAAGLRQVDKEVEKGDRNELGLKNVPEEDKFKNKNAKEQWETAMDTVKVAGSKTIGTGQIAAESAKNTSDRTSQRLSDAFNQICDNAQENEGYRRSISTIFSIVEKWLHKSLDTAGDVNTDTSLESFIDDPTSEKHLVKAVRGAREFFERQADGKSLDDFFAALRVCGVSIQRDENLRKWTDDVLNYLQKSLDEKGYVRSGESQEKRQELRERWDRMMNPEDPEGEEGRKWRENVDRLKSEWREFNQALQAGEDLGRVRKVQAKLASDIEDAFLTAANNGADNAANAALDQPVWLWQDVFNAYLPRLLNAIKDIPIPRIEYKDNDVEFVLEDLDISTFALLPGHVYIRNITDIDIQAPSLGPARTAVGSLTRIYAQGVQLTLREVSFYFNQKTASIGPSEFNGILELTLPPQGIDIDVVIRMIPSSPEGLGERKKEKGFWEVQRVEVKISDEMNLTIKQSNHQVLASVLKPVITSRFRETLQTALAENVRGTLDWLDSMFWDVGNRAEAFEDVGLGRGAALVAGWWSELGKLSRGEGGLFKGWKATGTGLIKDEGNVCSDAVFAMGGEPQVLPGEKRGPKGNFSESLKEVAAREIEVDPNELEDPATQQTKKIGEAAKDIVGEAKERMEAKYREVKSFKETVQIKAEEEKGRPGWESHAFDVSA